MAEPFVARRVVVADNDPEARDLAALDLRLEGHDVVGVASSGEEALALCAELRPEVLVVDHRMPPGPWGLEVARAVAQRHPEIRVVLYTNYEDADVIAGAREVGAVYLPKGSLAALRRAVSAPGPSAGGSGPAGSRPRSS